MAETLLPYAESRKDIAALVDEYGETTWAELNPRVNRLIHALRSRGLCTGSHVAILAGNRREYFELFSACAHASLIAVPINWHFVADEVGYVLRDCAAEAFFVDERFAELGAEAAQGCDLKVRACLGGELASFEPYEELLAGASEEEPADQGQGSVMFYTSGTTGRPKGVRRLSELGASPAGQQARSQGFSALLGIPPEGVTLVCGPVYHSAQWAFSQFPLDLGSTLVLRHKFDAAETLELIDRYQVTNVHLVPTQFVRLLAIDERLREQFSGSSLKVVLHGAAPCAPEVKRSMIDWWGPVISEYYGGTEGAVVSLISAQEWLERPTSVGKPLPIVEVEVVGENGELCAPNESGSLYVKSAIASGFEYHGDEEKTRAAYRAPNSFTMGDIGFLDEDGYLHLTDRKIDMIISGGVNIYPAEVEKVLGDHPSVSDVAVFGVPDSEFGEQVKAVVELQEGVEPSPDAERELIDYCREHLAGYKSPRSIDFQTALPRQASGKLLKRLLRDPYWEGRERKI